MVKSDKFYGGDLMGWSSSRRASEYMALWMSGRFLRLNSEGGLEMVGEVGF